MVIETPDPSPHSQCTDVIGVDVGQRYLATMATPTAGAQFYCVKEERYPSRRTIMLA